MSGGTILCEWLEPVRPADGVDVVRLVVSDDFWGLHQANVDWVAGLFSAVSSCVPAGVVVVGPAGCRTTAIDRPEYSERGLWGCIRALAQGLVATVGATGHT